MAAQRYHYSDTIEDFLNKPSNEIIGMLTLANPHDTNNETSMSWVEEINILKTALADYAGRGSVYFEYNIPRMGCRPSSKQGSEQMGTFPAQKRNEVAKYQ